MNFYEAIKELKNNPEVIGIKLNWWGSKEFITDYKGKIFYTHISFF